MCKLCSGYNFEAWHWSPFGHGRCCACVVDLQVSRRWSASWLCRCVWRRQLGRLPPALLPEWHLLSNQGRHGGADFAQKRKRVSHFQRYGRRELSLSSLVVWDSDLSKSALMFLIVGGKPWVRVRDCWRAVAECCFFELRLFRCGWQMPHGPPSCAGCLEAWVPWHTLGKSQVPHKMVPLLEQLAALTQKVRLPDAASQPTYWHGHFWNWSRCELQGPPRGIWTFMLENCVNNESFEREEIYQW